MGTCKDVYGCFWIVPSEAFGQIDANVKFSISERDHEMQFVQRSGDYGDWDAVRSNRTSFFIFRYCIW